MRRGVHLLARLLGTLGLIVSAAPIGAQPCACAPASEPVACAMACCEAPPTTLACHKGADGAAVHAEKPACGCELQPAPSPEQSSTVEALTISPDWVALAPEAPAMPAVADEVRTVASNQVSDAGPPGTRPLAPDAGRAPPAC